MAPILGKKLPAFCHLIIHGVGLNGSAASLDSFLSLCQHESGLVKPLFYFSRNNAGNAFMTVRQINHQHIVVFQGAFLHLSDCLHNAILRHFLTTVI